MIMEANSFLLFLYEYGWRSLYPTIFCPELGENSSNIEPKFDILERIIN